MSTDRGRPWIDRAGVLAVVVGLIFVGYEIQQTRALAVSDRLVAATEVELSLRTALAEYATVWRRGCIGEELSEDELTVFTQLVYAVYFKQFMRWRVGLSGVGDNAELDYFPLTIAQNMYNFPGFSEAVSKFERLGSFSWTERIRSMLDEMNRGGAASGVDPTTCGLA